MKVSKRVALLLPIYNSNPEGRFARTNDFLYAVSKVKNSSINFDIVTLKSMGPKTKFHVYSSNNIFAIWRYLYKNRFKYDAIQIVSSNCYQFLFPKVLTSKISIFLGPNVLGFFPCRQGEQWNFARYSAIKKLKEKLKYAIKRRGLVKKGFGSSKFHKIFCFGEYHREMLISAGAPQDKLINFINGVRSDIFRPNGREYRLNSDMQLLYVGDLNHYKGFDKFLSLLIDLKAHGIEFKAIVIGKGKINGYHSNLALLNNHLELKGFVERKELGPFYRGSDIYVHPSQEEAHPTTMLEALACGTPVLAPHHMSFVENSHCINGVSNTLFCEQKETLSEVLLKNLSNLKKQKSAAKKLAPFYYIEKSVTDFIKKYSELIEIK